MMNNVLYARQLLTNMGKAPCMWATRREAYMMRVEAILDMVMQDEFDWRAFNHRHMRVRGPTCLDLDLPVETEWGRKVIADALEVIEGFRLKVKPVHSSELVACVLGMGSPETASPQDVFDYIKEKSRDPKL